MKLLNALGGAARRTAALGRAARGLRHPAARALPGLPAHHLGAVERARLRAPSSATCSTRPGRRSTKRALVQDEIELVLQVNGKLRGSDPGRRRRPTRPRSRRPRWPAPEFAKFADGAPVKKVIVVPGRLVNIVV